MHSKSNADFFTVTLPLQILNLKNHPEAIQSAARLQCSEWGKRQQTRIDQITRDLENPNGFPLHLIISTLPTPSNNENKKLDPKSLFVIGHAKISKSHHVKHGYSGIVYDVVIDQRFRGLGLGYKLMQKLEDIALRHGITYLYLFTHSAVSFYEKLGYKQRTGDLISDLRSNAKRLTSSQIKKLEVLFANKLRKYHESTQNVNPDQNRSIHRQNVWFTKRLCRLIAPKNHDFDAVIDDITLKNKCNESDLSIHQMHGFCTIFPFIEQVGPCCAFGAMSNIEYFVDNYRRNRFRRKSFGNNEAMVFIEGIHELDEGEDVRDSVLTLKSRQILNECIASGVCFDGEMMDIDALRDVLQFGFGNEWAFDIVDCDLWNFEQFIHEMNGAVNRKNMEQITFLMVPYDKDHDNYPRVRVQSENDERGLKHAEMDRMDISHHHKEHKESLGDTASGGMVASSAHYAVICGGFRKKLNDSQMIENEAKQNHLIGRISSLIEDTDPLHANMEQLRLIYMTSSKQALCTVAVTELIDSNQSLKGQLVPNWCLSNVNNLGGRMLKITNRLR